LISHQLQLLSHLSLNAASAEIKANLLHAMLEPMQTTLDGIYTQVIHRPILEDYTAQTLEPSS
jgi:hypothetical protein